MKGYNHKKKIDRYRDTEWRGKTATRRNINQRLDGGAHDNAHMKEIKDKRIGDNSKTIQNRSE
jgi:hypothetical protein